MQDIVTLGFKSDTSDILKADKALDNLGRQSTKTANQIDKSVDSANTSFMSLNRTLGLVGASIAALSSAQLSREIIEYSDTWKSVNNQLRQVTGSNEELIKTQQLVLNLAKETRSDLLSTTELYSELTRATESLGTTQEEVLSVTQTLNNLFLAGGKSAQESAGAIRQLGQALGAGALRGDEFNSVAEGAPRILDALSESLGMAKGELRDFAATGGITAEILVDALLDYEDAAQRAADQTEQTFAQSLVVAKTNVTEFVGEANALNSAVGLLGSGIVGLSEDLDALTDAGIAFASVIGGAAVIALGKKTAASAADALSTRAALKADVDKAVAANALAAAELKTVQSAAAKTAGFTLNAQAVSALTAAELKYAASLTTVDAAQKKVAASATLAGRATSFLLGPWGLLIGAVTVGVLAFRDSEKAVLSLSDATDMYFEKQKEYIETQKELNWEIEQGSKVLELYEQRQRDALANDFSGLGTEELQDLFDRASFAVEKYAERLEMLNERGASAARIAEVTAKLNEQKLILEQLGMVIPNASTSYEKLTSSVLKLTDELDPLQKITREYKENLALLNDAKEKGVAIVGGYDNALSLLNIRFDESKEKLKESKNQTDDLTDSYQRLLDRLDPLAALTKENTRDGLLLFGLREKQLITEEEYIKLTEKLTEEFKEQKESIAGVSKEQQEFASLQDEIAQSAERIGTAFQTSGNGIIDTFGEAIGVLSDFGGEMERLTDLQARLDAEKEKGVDITKEQAQLDEQMVSAQLSGIGAILGASANLFDEQSKEREALHRAEVAFSAIELALAAQKAIANAKTAIASAFAAPFPVNFAAGAAMIGIMSGLLGVGFGGGGASAPVGPAGTGTVLGDSSAQSESINNSQDLFEEIQLEQLAELRGIRDSISDLASGIVQLTRGIIGSGGLDMGFVGELGRNQSGSGVIDAFQNFTITGVIDNATFGILSGILGGILGSTSRDITEEGIRILSQSFADILANGELEAEVFAIVQTTTRRLFGLVKNESSDVLTQELDSDFTRQLGAIFGSIYDVALNSAEILGFETVDVLTASLENVVAGFNADDVQSSITEAFGEYFAMVTTTTEMSIEDALASFEIPEIDISFTDKTGEEIQQELEAAIGSISDELAEFLFPSLTQFQQIGEGLFETLQRVTVEQVVFNDAIEMLGASLDGVPTENAIRFSQSVISAIGGLDAFQDAFSAFSSEFFTEAEQFENLTQSLADVFTGIAIPQSIEGPGPINLISADELPETREEFRALIEEVASLGEAGADTLAILLELSPAFDAYFDELEAQAQAAIELANTNRDLEIQLLSMTDASAALEIQRQLELEAVDASTAAILEQIFALEDQIAAEQAAAQLASEAANLNIRIMQLEGDAAGALAAQRELELEAADESLRPLLERIFALEDEAAAAQALVDIQNLNIQLLELQGESEEALRLSRELQLESATDAERAILELIFAEQDRIAALNEAEEAARAEAEAYEELVRTLESGVSDALSRLSDAVAAEIDTINSELAESLNKYAIGIEEIDDQIESLNNQYGELNTSLDDAFSALNSSIELQQQQANDELTLAENAHAEELSRIEERRQAAIDADAALRNAIDANFALLQRSITAEQDRINALIAGAQKVNQTELDALEQRRSIVESELALLNDSVRSAFGLLSRSIVAEIDAINSARDAELSVIQSRRDAVIQIENEALELANNATAQLNAAFDAEQSLIRRNAQIRIDSINDEISANQQRASQIGSSISGLQNITDGLSDAVRSIENQRVGAQVAALRDLDLAIASARRGDFALAGQLDLNQLVSGDADQFSTLAEFELAQAETAQKLSELESLTGSQLSIEQQTLNSLTAQESALRAQISTVQIASDAQIAALEQQLNELIGVDASVLSVADAIALFEQSNADVQSLNSQSELDALDALEDEINANSDSQIELLNSQLDEAQAQLDALNNVDNSIGDVNDAIDALNAVINERLAFDESAKIAEIETAITESNQSLLDSLEIYNSQLETLDSQLENAQLQLDAINNVDNSIVNVELAITLLSEAITAFENSSLESDLAMQDAAEESANTSLEDAQTRNQELLDSLDLVVAEAQLQLDELRGIDSSVKAVDEAIVNFENALTELQDFALEEQIAELEENRDVLLNLAEIAESQAESEIALLESSLEFYENQLDALMGIDNSILSVADAVLLVESAINNLANETGTPVGAPVFDPYPVVASGIVAGEWEDIEPRDTVRRNPVNTGQTSSNNVLLSEILTEIKAIKDEQRGLGIVSNKNTRDTVRRLDEMLRQGIPEATT